LGERLLCKQEVTGSIPVSSTNFKLSAVSSQHSVKQKTECSLLSAECCTQSAAQAADTKTIFDN
jgi:hypothetical protein